MRLTIMLQTNNLTLPVQYESILQGLIYRSLSNPKLAAFLHNQGYAYHKRSFKMFAFSKLIGKGRYKRENKTLTFNGDVKWHVSSALEPFIQDLGQAFLLENSLQLHDQHVFVKELTYHHPKVTSSTCRIRMLSPITVASTFEADDGGKVTQYYSPYDVVFSPMVEKNLKRKYEAFTNKVCDDPFEIIPISVKRKDKVVTKFKGTIINAWGGTYELRATPKLINFAHQVGLGGRNSAGFGLFEVI